MVYIQGGQCGGEDLFAKQVSKTAMQETELELA